MTQFNLDKNHLYALLLAFMAMLMLSGCSSTDEASQSEDPSSSSCEDACRSSQVPDFQLDECLMACEIT
jgi:hypothetical protein